VVQDFKSPQPDSQQQRAKAVGWGAGELAARLKSIDQVFEKLKNGQSSSQGESNP